MGSFSIWHWLIVLLIVVMVFGTKKLKNIGSDLGGAVKGFKDGMKEGGTSEAAQPASAAPAARWLKALQRRPRSTLKPRPSPEFQVLARGCSRTFRRAVSAPAGLGR